MALTEQQKAAGWKEMAPPQVVTMRGENWISFDWWQPLNRKQQNRARQVEKYAHRVRTERDYLNVLAEEITRLEEVTIRCVACGEDDALQHRFKCLYCKSYFCKACAERHFGQTVEEYRASKHS